MREQARETKPDSLDSIRVPQIGLPTIMIASLLLVTLNFFFVTPSNAATLARIGFRFVDEEDFGEEEPDVWVGSLPFVMYQAGEACGFDHKDPDGNYHKHADTFTSFPFNDSRSSDGEVYPNESDAAWNIHYAGYVLDGGTSTFALNCYSFAAGVVNQGLFKESWEAFTTVASPCYESPVLPTWQPEQSYDTGENHCILYVSEQYGGYPCVKTKTIEKNQSSGLYSMYWYLPGGGGLPTEQVRKRK